MHASQLRFKTIGTSSCGRKNFQVSACLGDDCVDNGEAKARACVAGFASGETMFLLGQYILRNHRPVIDDPRDAMRPDHHVDNHTAEAMASRIVNQVSQGNGEGIHINLGNQRDAIRLCIANAFRFRGGSGNLHIGDKWSFCLNAA